MDANQKKLLEQLAQLCDIIYIKNTKEALIKAISEMDVATLKLILEDDVSYQDTTKTIFLQKLEDIFIDFKSADAHLIHHDGQCNSEECSNKNKKGCVFVGNQSGRYINFIIEQEDNGRIKDIYNCSSFCTDNNVIEEYKREISLSVYADEKVGFKPSLLYSKLNTSCITAVNELKQYTNTEIPKEEIIAWIKRYEALFDSFRLPPIFYKEHSFFYNCYRKIFDIYEYINLEEEAANAIKEFKETDAANELQLLKWLVKNEPLSRQFILLYGSNLTEESEITGREKLTKNLDVYFKTEILKNGIEFHKLFDQYYYEKLNKYNTFSKEEQEALIPFDDNYDEVSTLKYHLEKRKII